MNVSMKEDHKQQHEWSLCNVGTCLEVDGIDGAPWAKQYDKTYICGWK